MPRIVFDIESDGLLDSVTKAWVLCTYDLDNQEEKQFVNLEADDSWKKYLDTGNVLAGHNIISYDLNVLKKLYNWVPKPHVAIHDTLIFSQMMGFRRFGFKGHSLEQWGQALGDHKIEFNNWTELTEEMILYCIQDVRLNVKVYKYLLNEFTRLAAKEPMLKLSIRNEHSSARFMAEAELRGWLFNQEKAIPLLAKMEEEINSTKNRIEPTMGLKTTIKDRINTKTFLERIPFAEDIHKEIARVTGNDMDDLSKQSVVGETKYPKWNQNGHYAAHIANWFGVPAESGLYTDCIVEGPFCRVLFEPLSLASPDDAKIWLHRIGWVPDDWNYKRNEETKKMEIVSEKISESSLLELGEFGELYNTFLTTNSRANILRGWISSCDANSRIHGGAMNFGTPTGRMTHKLVANVPGVEAPWGAEVRDLFMADPGTVIIGCDSSGNQMRAFCHHLGNAEFTHQVLDGDIHQANADVLTKVMQDLGYDIVVTRKQAKTFIYAFLFGVGAEKAALYITGKRDAALGAKIKAGFATNVVGLAELNAKLEGVFSSTKKTTGFGYIYGLDGSRIYSDSFHKVLNYLLQRFESVTVKSAIYHMTKKLNEEGIWWRPLIIYHDEVQFLVKDDPEIIARAKEIAHWAFKDAAQEFGVTITDGEAKHGYSWKETH